MSGIKARVLQSSNNASARINQTNQLRAKQVAIGSGGGTDLSTKNLSELADVNVAESDDGLLQYDAASDTWSSSNTLDGGTF
tara:strand:+ start:555 stop:800 length:246 start_codon:yes stop_codon:yes gene_type:complete